MIPVISGTVAGQTASVGQDIDPFANVTITDGNDYIANDTLTISLLGADGQPTDANGTLVLPAADLGNATFSETSPGVYTLTENATPSPTRDLSHFQPQLANLTFIPSQAATTTFALYNVDTYGENQSDSTTTVIASGAGTPVATPTPDTAATPDTSATTQDASTTTPDTAAAPDTSTTTPATTQSTTTPNDQTINGRVGRHTTETVNNDSVLTIDHALAFHGQVDLTSGVIDLNGLAAADSYSFTNDILSIYSASGRTLDALRFTSNSSAFSVEKTSSGISIYTADDTRHPDGALLSIQTS